MVLFRHSSEFLVTLECSAMENLPRIWYVKIARFSYLARWNLLPIIHYFIPEFQKNFSSFWQASSYSSETWDH